MIYFGIPGWQGIGDWVFAVSLMAMLCYLAPGMMALSPLWRGRLRIAAIGLLAIALMIAIGASVMWFMR